MDEVQFLRNLMQIKDARSKSIIEADERFIRDLLQISDTCFARTGSPEDPT